jgi:hypothetical protein
MMTQTRKTSLLLPDNEGSGLSRLEVLRKKIDSEDYLYEAIHRIALIISNELLDIPQGGRYELQRKSRQWPHN